jgi:hypothetical protein
MRELARPVQLVAAATLALFFAVGALAVWVYFAARHSSERNRDLIHQLQRQTDRQDAQLQGAVYVICIKLGETDKNCKKLARGLLLPRDFDASKLTSAGRVEQIVGPRGLQGLQGLSRVIIRAGLTGAKGKAGVNGMRGPPGAQGPPGRNGVQGPPGAKGDAGARGPQGPPGPRGLTGARGPTGPCFPKPRCQETP